MPSTKYTRPLLEILNLKTWFPIRRGIFSHTVGHVKAVDGVSLKVHKGETLGLVGESGCGKSTLGRTLMALERPHEGKIIFHDQDISYAFSKSTSFLRRQMQMIFQDPYSSLNPRMTVLDIITEGILQHKLIDKKQKVTEAIRMLNEVGLDKACINRYPHEFSGGQRQRISIARALSMSPKFIVCDEAVSALDVSVQAQVINLLMDLRDKYDLSYLFISHDLSVVRQISKRIAVMYLGQIVEEGNSKTIVQTPQHPYTRALIEAVPEPGKVKKDRKIISGEIPSPANPPPGCRFHTRCPLVQDICKQKMPELKPTPQIKDETHLAACHFPGQ